MGCSEGPRSSSGGTDAEICADPLEASKAEKAEVVGRSLKAGRGQEKPEQLRVPGAERSPGAGQWGREGAMVLLSRGHPAQVSLGPAPDPSRLSSRTQQDGLGSHWNSRFPRLVHPPQPCLH